MTIVDAPIPRAGLITQLYVSPGVMSAPSMRKSTLNSYRGAPSPSDRHMRAFDSTMFGLFADCCPVVAPGELGVGVGVVRNGVELFGKFGDGVGVNGAVCEPGGAPPGAAHGCDMLMPSAARTIASTQPTMKSNRIKITN
jgi:hypothetical protein